MGRHERPILSPAEQTDDPRGLIRPELLAFLPDTSSPEFLVEARRQALAAADSPHEAEDQAFVDAISVYWDEE